MPPTNNEKIPFSAVARGSVFHCFLVALVPVGVRYFTPNICSSKPRWQLPCWGVKDDQWDLGRLVPAVALRSVVAIHKILLPITSLFGRIGARAKMAYPIHPHMLRHGCGFALANAGHDTRALQAWLGHKNIQHTVRYTELAPDV
jgi:Phage integrase family